jgi:hypothetical protein
MGLTGCQETSVRNYHFTLCKNQNITDVSEGSSLSKEGNVIGRKSEHLPPSSDMKNCVSAPSNVSSGCNAQLMKVTNLPFPGFHVKYT